MFAQLFIVILAATPAPAPRWSVSAAAATDVPLLAGVAARAESPQRIRLALTMGVLPDPYLDLINATAVAAGAYDEDEAKLIKASLKQSLVVRAAGGWRPFRRRGFFAEVGYTSISLGGNVAGQDLVALATGAELPAGVDGSEQREYDVASRLHLLGAEAGWEWRLRSHPVEFRTALGFATTVAAQTEVEPRFRPLVPGAVKVFTDESAAYLDGLYLDYVHVPVLSLSAGWRF